MPLRLVRRRISTSRPPPRSTRPGSGRAPHAAGKGLVESFAVYYVVGAVAGIVVNEIWRRRRTRPEVDDYGVSQARYLLVPSLSGTAACGGVSLVALLAGNSLLDLVNTSTQIDYARLSLSQNITLAAVAAIFGLAPGRLFGALDTLGDSLASEITTSEATGSGDDEE